MKYLAFAMKIALMIIGLTLIFRSWEPMGVSSECLTWLAIFITGLYLALQGKFGENFTGCLFPSKQEKKKGFFGR